MRRLLATLMLTVILGTTLPGGFALAIVAPNDPYVGRQWYVDSLFLRNVWDKSQGQGVVVAIIDSGVDTDHPDLINRIWKNPKEIAGNGVDDDRNGFVDDVQGWDFVDNDNDPNPSATVACFANQTCHEDAFHHGTLIAGIIAAELNNAFGIAGIAPRAKIMPLRTLDSGGFGDSGMVVDAILYAVENGADIINMSFVGTFNDPALEAAIEYAYSQDVAVVIAAGNAESGEQLDLTVTPRYPVCSVGSGGNDIALGVSAHRSTYALADFANYGNCVDLIAPGNSIFGLEVYAPEINQRLYYNDGYRGTSLAAPMVAGALALLRSTYPDEPVSQLYDLLLESALNVNNVNQAYLGGIGAGALNIQEAFRLLEAANAPEPNVPAPGDDVYQGRLLTTEATDSVYYITSDGKRYVFPDVQTYYSWYVDFSGVATVSQEELNLYPLSGIVTYRPGRRLVKIQSVPHVYAVGKGGVFHWVSTESIAKQLYGADWVTDVRDLPDSFFINYSTGSDITDASQFDVVTQLFASRTINQDKGLE